MIQAADAGIGIVGKEGRQAALASDFALTQFSHIGKRLFLLIIFFIYIDSFSQFSHLVILLIVIIYYI